MIGHAGHVQMRVRTVEGHVLQCTVIRCQIILHSCLLHLLCQIDQIKIIINIWQIFNDLSRVNFNFDLSLILVGIFLVTLLLVILTMEK